MLLEEAVDEFGIPESGKSFLPEKVVMLDCEMVGVVPERDDLLQIAMLKLVLKGGQYEESGEPLNLFLHSDQKPSNQFHKEHLMHVFDACNKSDITPDQAKKQIHEWLGDWKGKVQPCGDCVPTDMSFLYAKGCADRPDINDSGQVPGTFHYEFFDLNAVKAIARTKVGKKFEHDELPAHDALNDCKNQLVELNHYLEVLL